MTYHHSWQDNFSGAHTWQDNFGAAPVETPVIWSPDNRKQRAINLHSAILVFNSDMARVQKYPPGQEGQLGAWRAFRDRWAKWYGATSYTTWLLSSTDTLLDGYEKELAGWRDWYATNIGSVSGQGPTSYVNTPLIPTSITVQTPDIKAAADTAVGAAEKAKDATTWVWAGLLMGGAALGLALYSMKKKGSLGALDYPGSTKLFELRGQKGLWSEKQHIKALAKRGLMTQKEARLAIRDLEHDWFHFKGTGK